MRISDRVKVSSTTTGTGDFTLGSAETGFLSFSNGTFYYVIDGGAEWEIGLGTITSTTLVRSVIKSSNSNNLVDFSAGTKYVFIDFSTDYLSESGSAYKVPVAEANPFLAETWLSGLRQHHLIW